MTHELLTNLLAEKVMGWKLGPNRFMMANREWTPRWRFQPTRRYEDAFRLLDQAAPSEYSICGDEIGTLRVVVQVEAGPGIATGRNLPAAISTAIARAFGLGVSENSDLLAADGAGAERASGELHGK